MGALKDAELNPDAIDQNVLVGGSTRIPAVQSLVQKLLGKMPNQTVNPDEVVAVGAAVQAGVLGGEVKDILLLDVIPLFQQKNQKHSQLLLIINQMLKFTYYKASVS